MARRQKRDVISEEDSSLKEVVQAILTALSRKPYRAPSLVIPQLIPEKV